MKLTLTLDGGIYRVHHDSAYSLAIPLVFDGPQPNHFGVDNARAEIINSGGFIGSTRQGGSCNVKKLQLTPHCNGTHTESVEHIVDQTIPVGELGNELTVATLITIEPEFGGISDDNYQPELDHNDKVISEKLLRQKLESVSNELLSALIIRTLPNPQVKMKQLYDQENQPPFFTEQAMRYLVQKGVAHLLVDFPSLDKMYDEGLLTNHHTFWNVAAKTHELSSASLVQNTVTEMIYVSDAISDGFYLLSLQIAPFQSDAAPSRPIIYPLEKVE